MFKKKPIIKPLAPLRSSDRRKIADQIIADFQIDITSSPQSSEGQQPHPQPYAQDSHSGDLTAVRNSILPENCLYGKFTTTAGPDLKPVHGVVYVGSYHADDQRILWTRVDDKLFPTVYTLWRNPRLVPLLHTPSAVVAKLRGGADLMTPGLARGPPFPKAAIRDAVVAIASDEQPSVPLVVGVCEIDVAKLQKVRGEKGRAVRSVHWVGDELWEWSTGGKPGVTIPEAVDGWDLSGDNEVEHARAAVEDLDIEDPHDEGGVSLTTEQAPKPEDASSSGPGQAQADAADEAGDRQIETQGMWSPTRGAHPLTCGAEIDTVFRQAFIYGLWHYKGANPNQPGHGLHFPLSSSFVISDLVLPFLPSFSPAETAAYQLKKTSWKNAKKFIKHLDKEALVKCKERSGGEMVILDIDFEDREVTHFQPYDLPKKSSADAADRGGSKSVSDRPATDAAIGQKLRRVSLYRPKDKLAPIFSAGGSKLKSIYVPTEIRELVTSYIEAESLVNPTNKRMVKLDPVLANAVFDSPKDQAAIAKGEVTREALVERVVQACSTSWIILRADQTIGSVKPKSGTAPQIQIMMETRSGNKTVTKTSGLEVYHINPQLLADELQKTCASSTSVNQLVGSSPKSPLMEVMAQGPQSQAVIKALEKRGVNRQWMDVVDKTKGKKKG